LRRNSILRRVIEVKIKGGLEVTWRRGRRRRKLLDDLKERRGYSHLKEEALDSTMWRPRFGRCFGPVVRQTAKCMNGCRAELFLGACRETYGILEAKGSLTRSLNRVTV
jgi:hypothetical protein